MRADILKRLAALKLPTEAFQEVLAIVAELLGADDARRERERVRRSQYKRGDGPKDEAVTVTGRSHDGPPSNSLKKERKIPEANASGGSQAELERDFFSRGRHILGKNAGGLLNSLLKAKQHDVALARSTLELAATKHDPREFVAAATRSTANGARNPTMAAFDDLIARAEGGEVTSDPPMRDITPRSS